MLLSSGALEIRCECAQFAEGQFSTPPCPLLTFQFHVLEANIRDQYLIDSLSNVNRIPGLSPRQLMTLRSAVVKAVRQPDNRNMFTTMVGPAFEADVLHNTSLLKAAVRLTLAREKAITRIGDFALRFQKVAEDRFEAETNLPQKLNLGVEDVHNILRRAVLGISGVDQRIGEMNAHSALSGFTAEELPLFRSKLDSIVEAYGSQRQEQRFQRLITIAGLPRISADSRIDMEKLLRVRREPEAVEFRGWLADTDKLSDSEIRLRVAGLNVKLGLAAQTGAGKALRLLVTTVASLLPPLGFTLSALDQFAWDKFARRSGVAAFVQKLYPSIFTAARGE
jgi:hypothetical protein